MNLDNLSLPITYELQDNIDSRFRKISIWVMHDNLNLNNTYFDLDTIEDAKESLKNIPILAFVKKQDGTDVADFGGHEMELVIQDNDIKLIYTGRPIGIVPSENNYRYEKINDKTYVVVDGYIWTDYANEALDILERDKIKNHSMEIKILSFTHDNDKKYTIVNKYKYLGLTLIGDDKKPAMQGSKAELFTYDFDQSFYTLVDELNNKLKNFSQNQLSTDIDINTGKGGKNVERFKELFEKYSITKEQILEFDSSINFEEISIEDMENKIIEFAKQKDVETFSLTAMQLKDFLRAELNKDAPMDEWGYPINPYYYIDHNDSVVWAEERANSWIPVQFDYSLNGEAVTISFDSKKICKWQLIPIEEGEVSNSFVSDRYEQEILIKEKELQKQFASEKESLINEYQAKIDEANEKYTKLEQTSKELQEYQANKLKEERELAETELFERFSTQLTAEEINTIKEVSSQFTVEQLEEKLYVLLGKKNAQFTTKKDKGIKIPIISDEKPKSNKIWADLVN